MVFVEPLGLALDHYLAGVVDMTLYEASLSSLPIIRVFTIFLASLECTWFSTL